MAPLLGIEIGGTKLQLVLGDTSGSISKRERLAVDPAHGAEGIRAAIESLVKAWTVTGRVAAVGVGFGGPVDRHTGRICCSHQISGWSDFPLRIWLEEIAGAPVTADNDANVAALGESRYGAGKGRSPVFYVTLGSGVGGGFVIDQKIYHGALPGEAEIGHVRLDRDGTIVEHRCSGWAVDARLRALVAKQPNGILANLVGSKRQGEATYLRTALEAGDAEARAVLEDVCTDLAFALSHVTHLFHPEMIVIGGGLSLVGEPLRSRVEKALARFVMEAFHPVPEVVLARLGEDAVPVGALELASQLLISRTA